MESMGRGIRIPVPGGEPAQLGLGNPVGFSVLGGILLHGDLQYAGENRLIAVGNAGGYGIAGRNQEIERRAEQRQIQINPAAFRRIAAEVKDDFAVLAVPPGPEGNGIDADAAPVDEVKGGVFSQGDSGDLQRQDVDAA